MGRREMCFIAFICLGCGPSPDRVNAKIDLMNIGVQYHAFFDAEKRSPANLEELIKFEDEWANVLPGNKETQERSGTALQSQKYVVLWNANIKGHGGSSSDIVLAYEKDVPTKGGLVCMQSGEVKQMSADEFAKAEKAGQ